MVPSKEEKIILEMIDMYQSFPAIWKMKSKFITVIEIRKDIAYERLLAKYRDR